MKRFVHCHCTIVFKGIVANNHLDHLIFFIYCNRIFGPTFTLSEVFFHHILSVKYFSTVCHSTTKAQFLMSRIHMSWKIPYISEILITLITVVWSLVMAFLWTWSVFDDLNPFWQTEHETEYSFEEWAFLWWEYDEEWLKVVPSTSQTEGVILIKSIPITLIIFTQFPTLIETYSYSVN